MILKITINNTLTFDNFKCHQWHFKNNANVIHDTKFNFGKKNKLIEIKLIKK